MPNSSDHGFSIEGQLPGPSLPVAAREHRTIDMTPTWRAILPMLLEAHANGNAKGRAIAYGELCRLADIADRIIAADKAALEAKGETKRQFRIFYDGRLIGYENATNHGRALRAVRERNPNHIAGLFEAVEVAS